jgi:hypothetical protein
MRAPAADLVARFTVLDDKDAGGAPSEGHVVGLSRRGAEIASTSPAPAHANLKLAIVSPDGATMVDDVYAKVIPRATARETFAVTFTSLSTEAEAWLDATLRAA